MNRNLRDIEENLWNIINEVDKLSKDTIQKRLQILAFRLKLLKKEDKKYNSIFKKQHTIIKKAGLG